MKNKLMRILSLVLSLLVVFSSMMFLTSCSDENAKKIEYVDEKIQSTITAESFETEDEKKQVEKVKQVLKKLEEEEYITKDSVVYDESSKTFSFNYADGTLGGVSLNDFGKKYNNGAVVTNNTKFKNQNNIKDADQTAKILNAFENEPFRRDYYVDLEKDWEKVGITTDVDVDVTVEDLKKLKEFDIVVFAMHGSLYRGTPVICINENVTESTDEAYEDEIDNKVVARVMYKDGTNHYWILPEFFTYQYKTDEWESDIIFSETCMFFGDDSVNKKPDYTFANALDEISKGAIIGYHNSVGAKYSRNIMKYTIQKAADGKKFSETLELAKNKYGEDDNLEDKKEGKYIAYPIFAGEANARLVEIPVTDVKVPSELVITLGELGVIEPEIEPADASGYSVKWSSSDEAVATVSPTGEAGIITSLSKGTTTITAELTSGGKTITKTTKVRVASKARDTVLVLDVSGSMQGSPMEEMKKSAIQFCNDLLKDEYNNRVGLVFYDDELYTTSLTSDLDMLINQIEAIEAGGLTDMESGLAAADTMLKNYGKSEAIKNVVVMADGLPNEGKSSLSGSMPTGSYSGYYTSVEYANAVIDTAKGMMKNYNLYSLGFFHGLYGEEKDFAVALMQELTNKTDGYHQVDKAEDLQFAFGDISEEISVGSKIVINIACPVDVTVTYDGEILSSDKSCYCDATSFGTLQLIGKDKDIKVVSLDSDKQYDVEIVGTGTGDMDYTVSYFDENEKLEDSRSFESVPITDTTVIKSDTDNTSKDIKLDVDEDGDGEIDITWTALSMGKGEITYDKNPDPVPTSQSNTEGGNLSVLAIVLISVLALMLILGGMVMIAVFSARQRKKEDEVIVYVNKDGEEISEDGMIMCPICKKSHKKDYDCTARKNENQLTEDKTRTSGVIQVTNGSMSGFSVPVRDGEVLYLGKDPKVANLVFTNDYKNVSRVHCAVTFNAELGRYYVTDSSSNGTYFINKKRLVKGQRTPVNINSVLILANEDCTILLG